MRPLSVFLVRTEANFSVSALLLLQPEPSNDDIIQSEE